MAEKLLPYTVVGVYPDDLDKHVDAEGATYVEWVEAHDPEEATCIAQGIDEDRLDAVVVAVFEGHMVDKLYDKGLASG